MKWSHLKRMFNKKMSHSNQTPLFFLLVLVIVISIGASINHQRAPIASSEIRFVEHSSKGLEIVPASCPSSPDYVGQCGNTNCSISASPSSLAAGQSVTLSWTVSPFTYLGLYGTSISLPEITSALESGTTLTQTAPTFSPAMPSGSTLISPAVGQTTVYTLSGTYTFLGMNVGGFSCSTGGVSVAATTCPDPSDVLVNGQCVPNTTTPGQCTAGNMCGADGNLYSEDAQCNQKLLTVCKYGCSGGACIPAPNPEVITWKANPALVRKGGVTDVQWEVKNVDSCTVTGTNGDSWSGLSGLQTSGIIPGQTTYTLHCPPLPGSLGDPVNLTAIVNITPGFIEQ